MKDPDLMLTTDHYVWAEEFVKRYGGDKELMASWFASAMCTARDKLTGPPNGDTLQYMLDREKPTGKHEAGDAHPILLTTQQRQELILCADTLNDKTLDREERINVLLDYVQALMQPDAPASSAPSGPFQTSAKLCAICGGPVANCEAAGRCVGPNIATESGVAERARGWTQQKLSGLRIDSGDLRIVEAQVADLLHREVVLARLAALETFLTILMHHASEHPETHIADCCGFIEEECRALAEAAGRKA